MDIDNWSKLEGRLVLAVDGADVYLDTGEAFKFALGEDCCSISYFTDDAFLAFQELTGATITSAESRSGASSQSVVDKYPNGEVLT